MESSLGPLLPLFERERASGHALALGVLVQTAGSTYRKPGALMLIAANGDYSGLLSGGCLERDLCQHARSVIREGEPRILSYDTRGPDDLLWGLGLGCEGSMRILLLRAGPDRDWQPVTHLARALASHMPTAVGIVVESTHPDHPAGAITLPQPEDAALDASSRGFEPQSPLVLYEQSVQAAIKDAARSGRAGWVEGGSASWKLFVLPLSLPPRVLILGAGPDAAPVVDFAARLGWKVTVVDHRPAYAQAAHFPLAEGVVLARPDEISGVLVLAQYSAAVVMSHHLPSDLAYLRALAATAVPYVGLLGPRTRRENLLADLGPLAERLRARLRAPVGLTLGGRTPESIALSIIAEIHAFVHGADGRHANGHP
jgi:xanthine dehydrogenase accessory factor